MKLSFPMKRYYLYASLINYGSMKMHLATFQKYVLTQKEGGVKIINKLK